MSNHSLDSAVTVLHGDNRLEIAERVAAARRAIDPSELSTSIFEQASGSISEVASAIGSPGFFGSDRLVICHNLVTPATGGRRRKAANLDDGSDPLGILGSIAPGVWVVIVEDSVKQADERRIRSFASDVTVQRIDVPRGRALIDWMSERARRHSAIIDGATATRLVESLYPGSWRQAARRDDVPPDMHRLDAELAKLAAYAGSGVEITAKMVDELVSNVDAMDIWGLTNAIADRDQSRAIKQLEASLDHGQPPEMILGQLAAQFETFAIVHSAGGRPAGEVATRTGLTEGRLRQANRSARNFDRSDLRHALCEIRDADFGIKQGLLEPENALASLVASLAHRR